ncbi:hypothetical protein [Streptosporangium saharense]|uniref:YycE-like C-terminal domain-containing protein n=1 Tax=Streptosporangium saharense TaxID=1706840 RepID=A0A7W7VPD2_9ACTN|nr:hypothetical protein [Streptosporangium saharense]MBB4917563.1 hypothetical protein [Streptosporangium saharense]
MAHHRTRPRRARPSHGRTHDPDAPLEHTPTVDDLLVLYLAGPIDQTLLDRLLSTGGVRVPSHNPYWDAHGVTHTDPDGYRLVLSTRSWNPGTVAKQ